MTRLDELEGLTAADVMHRQPSSVPVETTVGELREYFAVSSSRRLALVVDGKRYVGSIALDGIPDEVEATAAAAAYAHPGPTTHPQAPAETARDQALEHPTARLPVVAETGELVGIVAINKRRDGFCRA